MAARPRLRVSSRRAALSLPVLDETSYSSLSGSERLILKVQRHSSEVDLRDQPSICRGNEKLGTQVWTFSLPPVVTCAVATPACLQSCYAMKYANRFSVVLLDYTRNMACTHRDDFAEVMRTLLLKSRVKILRLHVSGEFYSNTYLHKWIEIARHSTATIFCYTRAWRDPEMRASLAKFAKLPNVRLWFSVDRDSRQVWYPKSLQRHVRLAYMSFNNDDLPVPGTSIVFKVAQRDTRTIKLGSAMVCPVENGTPAGQRLTCQTCRFCYDTAFKRDPASAG